MKSLSGSKRILSAGIAIGVLVVAIFAASELTKRLHKSGQLDVLTAQAMDMSEMHPPVGSSIVTFSKARLGSIADSVVYTGTIRAFNTQEIAARVPGVIVSLPVYPGQFVQTGQVVARLDSAELSAKTEEARESARAAQYGAQQAWTNHHVHHAYALQQAQSAAGSAKAAIADAQSSQAAAEQEIAGAKSSIASAQASSDYWSAEIIREKKLYEAGAVSLSEYQSEQSQSQAAFSELTDAKAKAKQAQSNSDAAKARIVKAQMDYNSALDSVKMAGADISLASEESQKQAAAAGQSQAVLHEAEVVQGYTSLKALYSGVVTERPIEAGSLVQPGSIVLKIASIDKVRVQAQVATSDLVGVRVGSPVSVSMQGEGSFQAKVTSIFPVASDDTRTAIVEAVVSNPGRKLIPGGYVTMRITKSVSEKRLLVPTASIVTSGDGPHVWIGIPDAVTTAGAPKASQYECEKCHMRFSAADAKKYNYVDPMDGGKLLPVVSSDTSGSAGRSYKAHRILVSPGASDGTWTAIGSGELSEGASVATSGMAGLHEGDSMRSEEMSK